MKYFFVKITFCFLVLVGAVTIFVSCEKLNPAETIPAYIKINAIKFPAIINESFYGKNNFQKALSFCLSAPNINTIILGTSKLKHLEEAIETLHYDGHSETQFYNLFNNK